MKLEEKNELFAVSFALALAVVPIAGGVVGIARLAQDEVMAIERLSETEKIALLRTGRAYLRCQGADHDSRYLGFTSLVDPSEVSKQLGNPACEFFRGVRPRKLRPCYPYCPLDP